MFTIDLRKGQGLPPKSRPILVAMAIVPFLIPLFGFLAMGVSWKQNSTLIRTQQKIIRDNQQKIGALQDNLKLYRQKDEQIKACSAQLTDVDNTLKYCIQTTPILAELVGNLPEFLTISELDLNRTEQRKKTAGEKTDAPKSAIAVQRKLNMKISGPVNETTDLAVKHYVQTLSVSPVLSKWIHSVRIISRNNELVNDRQFSLYEIECAMKDQI